jgi:N-acetylmuramoyl-L-alanine amidase
MPAAKLMNFHERIMRPVTKNWWLKDALIYLTIIVPLIGIDPVNAQSPVPYKQWVVVIDAGHGGKDPGSLGSTTKEKDIALSIALKTGGYIEKNLRDVKVIYTRDDDTFIGLDERAEVATKNNADLFISIHINASPDKKPLGTETYIMGQSKDNENLRLAMKENSVITWEDNYQTKYEGYDPNSAESFIIFSMMQNIYMKQSTLFASQVEDQFRDRVGRVDRGVKQAGFLVLWRTTMPSVLIECGFISNKEEEKYLKTVQGQEYMASGIYRAFKKYKQTIDYRSGINASLPVEEQDTETENITIIDSKTSVPEQAQTQKPVSEPSQAQVQETKTKVVSAPDSVSEIWFAIQIASSPKDKPKNIDALKDAGPITRLESGDRYKYVTGKYYKYDDATSYRRKISERYPDAFVIAVKGKTIIPLKDALKK